MRPGDPTQTTYTFRNSSMLYICIYYHYHHTLEVIFSNGQTYKYDQVPEDVFQNLMKADKVASPGEFFHEHIRSTYTFKRG